MDIGKAEILIKEIIHEVKDYRRNNGTWKIWYLCLFTIFLCVWWVGFRGDLLESQDFHHPPPSSNEIPTGLAEVIREALTRHSYPSQ